MQQTIIGISGKIGSGKDTLADFIIKHNNQFEKKSYAKKLKQIGSFLTGTDEKLWFTQEGKNINLPDWDMTIGQFQQRLGTEAIRNGLHQEAWILSLFADLAPTSKWLITDMRFKNEAYAIKQRGGKVLRINGDPAKVRANSTRDLSHPSETDLDDFNEWDSVYQNVGTLDNLETYAKLVLAKFTNTNI
jgi:hypothetical protein